MHYAALNLSDHWKPSKDSLRGGGGNAYLEGIKGQDVMWHMKKPWYPVRLMIRQRRNSEGQASLSRHVQ